MTFPETSAEKTQKIPLGLAELFLYSPQVGFGCIPWQELLVLAKLPMLLNSRKNMSKTPQFLIGLLLAVLLVSGCQANKSGKRTFFEPRTDNIPGILKPSERVAMIRMKGENGRKSDDRELKKELLEQLVEEYVNSPDSIVRQEVVTATSRMITASQDAGSSDLAMSKGFDLVKYAAMQDEDPFVRREACRVIAGWQRPESAVVLRHIVRNDNDKDVQLQAAESLAAFDDRDTIETLGSLLDHRQPALRYQAMQSLKVCTKEDYGNDVHRWKQYLQGEIPDPVHVPTLAERFRVIPMIY